MDIEICGLEKMTLCLQNVILLPVWVGTVLKVGNHSGTKRHHSKSSQNIRRLFRSPAVLSDTYPFCLKEETAESLTVKTQKLEGESGSHTSAHRLAADPSPLQKEL